MGITIIIITALIEIALGIYCIKTKSNQKTVRNIIRISTFAAFIIFTLTSVIKWGFQWQLLALTLLIWAIIGSISLLRRKSDKKEYKALRILLRAIFMWLILVVATLPALIFPQYKNPRITGQYEVKTSVYTYKDNNRIETFNNNGDKRKVTIEFWYPKNVNGRYPLVVFSHGAFGERASNTSTFMELASNGYIVCSISHPYHSMYTVDTEGKFTKVDKSFVQEVIDVNSGVYDNETINKLAHKWMKVRTDDIEFVLDTIIKKAKDGNSDEVYKIVDTEKIGLIGHSLGGAASAQLGRERGDIDAVINLDADLFGEYVGFVNGEPKINHDIYPVPILSIYTDDMKRLFARATEKGLVFPQKIISATAPNAYEVYIAGTNHLSLTDLPLFSPFLLKMIANSVDNMDGKQNTDKYYVIENMNSLALEFFEWHLKGSGSFHPKETY